MKKLSFALAVMPVLSLFTSVALADVSGVPLDSQNGIASDGEIKNRSQCPASSTFFKNAFPSLTNGTSGGEVTNNYTVDGKNVAVTVTWNIDNSFRFEVDGGYALRLGGTANNKDFVYDYTGQVEKGISDTQLNFYGEGLIADDVNHLDLCLKALDTDAPSIGAIVVTTLISDGVEPNTVTGPISIMTSITDESPLDPPIIDIFPIGSIDPETGLPLIDSVTGLPFVPITISIVGPTPMEGENCDPDVAGCTKYTWTVGGVDEELDDGQYTIRIISVDGSILANESFETKDIEVITALQSCLEGGDAVSPGLDGEGGCRIPGLTLEYPEALRTPLEGTSLTVTQVFIPAKHPETEMSDESMYCPGPYLVMDPRVNTDGSVSVVRTLDLNELFDVEGTMGPIKYTGLLLDETTVGSVCISVYFQEAPNFEDLLFDDPNFFLGFSLNDFESDPDVYPRPVSVLTQGPEDIEGYNYNGRLTAPLNFCDRTTNTAGEPNDPTCQELPGCFGNPDPAVQCYQPSQQFIERAVVQPDDNTLLIPTGTDSAGLDLFTAFDGTYEVYNRSRSTSYKGTLGVLNTRRVVPALGSALVPATAAYLEEELDAMILQTLDVFYDIETAIKQADGRGTLTSPNVTRLLNPHSKALGQIKNAKFERALRDLDDLLNQIYLADWVIDFNNDPGRLIMMVTAVRFQVEQHLAAQSCLEDPGCLAILDQ